MRRSPWHNSPLVTEWNKITGLLFRSLEKSLLVDPFSAAVHSQLAVFYCNTGEVGGAKRELNAAETLVDANDLNAERYMAVAYELVHNAPLAVRHYQTFLRDAKLQGVNPAIIQALEPHYQAMKARLTANYLDVKPPRPYTSDEMEKLLRERLAPAEQRMVDDPFDCTPEMAQWSRERTLAATSEVEKAQALFDALAEHLRLDNSSGGARGASEAFAVLELQAIPLFCEEFANLYVALARSVGLKCVFYVCDARLRREKCVSRVRRGKFVGRGGVAR